MWWSAWLLVSWTLQLGHSDARVVDDDALMLAARGLLTSMMLGLTLIWPAWRLSLPMYGPAGWQTLVDAAALLCIAQLVVWPLGALLYWPLELTLIIQAVLFTWTAITGLCIWGGLVGDSPASRSAGMALAAALALGGWLATALTGWLGPVQLNGYYMIWTLTDPPVIHAALWAALGRLALLILATAAAWAIMRRRFSPEADQRV